MKAKKKGESMNRGKVNTSERMTKNLDGDDRTLEFQWKSIDWKEATKTVSRTQTRIAKATMAENWKLVKELQRMLVHSFYAKALAVKTVTSNTGKNTPGVDGEIWDTHAKKMIGILTLKSEGYRAKPLKRVEIDKGKGDGSTRPLGIPTMYDRAMQCLYALALDPVAETLGDSTSYGFRKGRSAKDAGEQIFTCMNSKHRANWVLEADIKGFFDNISHEWLMENIPMDKSILEQFLKAGVVIKGKKYPTEKGTPQGGVISPIIANMVLDGLEYLIQDKYWRYDSRTGERRPDRKISYKYNMKKVNFIRYADDFIVTADSKEICEEIQELINPFLLKRGVELSREKTLITHIDDGFDFLGWNFRKYNGKLLIKPSNKSVQMFLKEVRDTINANKSSSQSMLIMKLNQQIRGWRNYHKHSVARDVFERVDNEIFQALWRWALRRHKEKGKIWVKERYWHTVDKDKWVFYDNKREFTHMNQRLMKLSNAKIIRHIQVQKDKNPYIDHEYFNDRAYKLGLKNITGKFKEVWNKQKGICPYCKERIEIYEGADYIVHHIIPKAWGGSDKANNLIYMHETCHNQYHIEYPVRVKNQDIKLLMEKYKPLTENYEWKSLQSNCS